MLGLRPLFVSVGLPLEGATAMPCASEEEEDVLLFLPGSGLPPRFMLRSDQVYISLPPRPLIVMPSC